MRVSTRGRYGLRALVDMAVHSDNGPVALHEIAGRQEVSESYLEQVFSILRKAGLVAAQRGSQGGYELGRPAGDITVGDVLRALEGPLAPVQCVDEVRAGRPCARETLCVTRSFWEKLRDHVTTFLDATSIQDLVDQAADAQQRGNSGKEG